VTTYSSLFTLALADAALLLKDLLAALILLLVTLEAELRLLLASTEAWETLFEASMEAEEADLLNDTALAEATEETELASELADLERE